MASSTKWFDNGIVGRESSLNSKALFTATGCNELALAMLTPSFSEIVLGEYTKWCSSLVYYPINFINVQETQSGSTMTQYYLNIGGVQVGNAGNRVHCYQPPINLTFGFTLGEYLYTGKYGDFRDFEPYTTLQIYLPFYGFVDVNIADVIGKYIQFRLSIDYGTGQAMYTIGVSTTSITSPNAPYYVGTDDTNTMIISKHVFSLGVTIPLGQTGMADAIRNVTMGSLKAVGSLALNFAVSSPTNSTTNETTKTVNTANITNSVRNKRNVQTINASRTTTKTSETTSNAQSNYFKRRAANTCFESGIDSLNSMTLRPQSDKPNNSFVDSQGSKSIKIVRRFSKVKDVDGSFNALYGMPLGEVRTLSNIHGYTEISAIHFEGAGFAQATSKEIAMIEQAFSDGVILP